MNNTNETKLDLKKKILQLFCDERISSGLACETLRELWEFHCQGDALELFFDAATPTSRF